MKYVFFGTPEFSAIILESLINSDLPPVALVCNPDRPFGRKKEITAPATKKLIQDSGLDIKIFQPEDKKELLKMSNEIFADADFAIVASYSNIISKDVIDKARLGIIGVHPSLLPKYRGASPIQSVILTGETETGVTLFILDEKVDHGPILAKETLVINEYTYLQLLDKLANLAGEMLKKILPNFVEEKLDTGKQDEEKATKTKKFSSDDGFIKLEDLSLAVDGTSPSIALAVSRVIRALNPEPGVYTIAGDKRTKLLAAELNGDKLVLKRIQKEGGKPIDI